MINNNPLGAIISTVSSSVFCAVKRNKKCLSADWQVLRTVFDDTFSSV